LILCEALKPLLPPSAFRYIGNNTGGS
jgi:hypothetical protein